MMKAIIFAAGRGERMGELTKEIPKPLLPVNGKPLIVYAIEKLKKAGINQMIINVAYLGQKIEQYLGDGSDYGVTINYSFEPYPLETGGAILFASELIGSEPFILVNADVWTDYSFEKLIQNPLPKGMLARLVMVENPEHNLKGDFGIDESQMLILDSEKKFTYSGISLIDPTLVLGYEKKREIFPLVEVFKYAIENRQLSGEIYFGEWQDIGTPERLAAIQ